MNATLRRVRLRSANPQASTGIHLDLGAMILYYDVFSSKLNHTPRAPIPTAVSRDIEAPGGLDALASMLDAAIGKLVITRAKFTT